MPSSRWQRIQDALWNALEHAPGAREAFLHEYCAGDPEMLAEVHDLLEAHEGAGDFLVSPVPSLGALLHVCERSLPAPTSRGSPSAPDSWLNRTVSHYQIFEKLGEGGMGVVYRARDTRLDRVVALKFPGSDFRDDEDAKARLIREARAASALDHVNICTIHEIGETETGQVFIAMACYAGETLAKKLERARLPLDEILGYTVEVARGLVKAHEQGLVHRDIKPANVMVTEEGVVKLLDFGLASPAGERSVRVGAVRATPAYMSPEQARGEPGDHRSDIWSLGVTIYEMLTGQRPFRGQNAQAVLDGIMNHEPDALAAVRPEVPGRLTEIVARALAKTPTERYGNARALLDDIEQLRQGSSGSLPAGAPTAVALPRPPTPGQLLPGGERVQATAVVWTLATAGEATDGPAGDAPAPLLRQARALVTEVVGQNGGVVQRGGTGEIVALFGIPTPQEDDCARGARSALEVAAELTRRAAGHAPGLRVGAGIHTGLILAREPRSKGGSHRAVGGPLRFAARLARHARAGEVLVSPESVQLLERLFETEPGAPLGRRGSERVVTPARIVVESPSPRRLGSAGRAGLSSYVGRTKELDTLRGCLRQIAAGTGHVVTVVGEAGLGKSRLLYEFRTAVERTLTAVCQGRCSSRSGYRPFQPFIEALQHQLGVDPDAPGKPRPETVAERIREVAPELEAYVPFYLHLLSTPSESHPLPKELEGQDLHGVLVKALAAVFTLSARRDPLVLLLDDWQWSDQASRSVLEQLIELVPAYPLLLVVTFRPDYQPAWAQPAHQTIMRLQPLDETAVTRIMESALHAEHLPHDVAAWFHERSGGNPFFLEEICRSLLEEGALRLEAGHAIPVRSLDKLILPSTVQAVIRTRLHRLDRGARSVIRMASVAGRTFTRDLLEDALRSDPGAGATLERSLKTLQTAGLIYRTHVLPEATYRFRHVLMLQAAYDSMLQHQRRRAHRLVGQAIEERFADDFEEHAEALAYHFGEAADWKKVARYSRIAAESSYRLGQLSETLALFAQARKALDRLPQDAERQQALMELLLRLERVYESVAGHEEQQAAIDELFALLGSAGDPLTLAEVHVRQGDLHILRGRFEPAEEALEEALRISRAEADTPGEQKALRGMGFLRWHQDRHEEAVSINEALVALDRQRGDTPALATDLLNLLTTLRRLKQFDRGLLCVEELLVLNEQLEDPVRKLPLYSNIAEFYRDLGEPSRALVYVGRALELIEQNPHLGSQTYQLAMRAQLLLEQGRVEESLQCYRDAIEIQKGGRPTSDVVIGGGQAGGIGLARLLRGMGEVLVALQREEEALPYLAEAVSFFVASEDPEAEALVRRKVALVHEGQGRAAAAQATWKQVRALCQRTANLSGECEALQALGRVARRQGNNDRAAPCYREALRLAEQAGDEARQGELHNTLGILVWKRNGFAEALTHYEQALKLFEARGDFTHAGLMLNSIGATLQKLGRPEEAIRRLEEAIRMHRLTQQRLLEGHALAVLGDVYFGIDRHTETVPCYTASLRLRVDLGDRRGEGWMLHRLARSYAAQGLGRRSRGAAARASVIAAEVGDDVLSKTCRSFTE